MKLSFFIFIVLFHFYPCFSQDKGDCKTMMDNGKAALIDENYKDAILKFQAAANCDPNLNKEANQNILDAFNEIESLKNKSEENSEKIYEMIVEITDLIYREENATIIGFNPLREEMSLTILNYYDYLKSISDNQSRSTEAKISLFLGLSQSFLDQSEADLNLKKAYKIAYNSIYGFENKEDVPNELIETLYDASTYYTWNLMNEKSFDDAKSILLAVDSISKFLIRDDASIFNAQAGYQNSLARLYKNIHNIEKSYFYTKQSIGNAKKACELSPENSYYKVNLAIFQNNLDIGLNSLITHEDSTLISQSYRLADEVQETPGTGVLGLSIESRGVYDQSFELVKQNKTEDAVIMLKESINKFNFFIHLDPTNNSLRLNKARLNCRLADLYVDRNEEKKINNSLQIKELNEAKNEWVLVVGRIKKMPSESWLIKAIYLKIRELFAFDNILSSSDIDQKLEFLTELENSIDSTSLTLDDIYLIAGDIYSNKADLLVKNESKYSEILTYYDKGIKNYSQSNILSTTNEFSEYFSWYARTISERLKLNYENGLTNLVIEDLKLTDSLFNPILKKYPFDYYVRAQYWRNYMYAGDLLFNEKKYSEAVPYLEYASKWGMKESTAQLAHIYREGLEVSKDINFADSLVDLSVKQSLKKLNIPCDFGGSIAPHEVYVRQYPRDYPYKGIDDQVEWLKVARGGIVPIGARDGFKKLQELAWKNNLSYPDLCVYALEYASEDEYMALKKELESSLKADTLGFAEKQVKFERLIESSRGSNNIYLQAKCYYIDFLCASGKPEESKVILNELILEFQNIKLDNYNQLIYKNEISQSFAKIHLCEYKMALLMDREASYLDYLNSKNLDIIERYYAHFIQTRQFKIAEYWRDNMMKNYEHSEIVAVLLNHPSDHNFELFKDLFFSKTELSNNIELIETKANDGSTETKDKVALYDYLIELDNFYIKQYPSKKDCVELKLHYNNLAWNLLLEGEFRNAEKKLNEALKIDPNYLSYYTNLPPSLLLQGKYKKATKLYKNWKDKPYDTENGFPLFKDAFIADLKDFEELGIIPEEHKKAVEDIRELLKK